MRGTGRRAMHMPRGERQPCCLDRRDAIGRVTQSSYLKRPMLPSRSWQDMVRALCALEGTELVILNERLSAVPKKASGTRGASVTGEHPACRGRGQLGESGTLQVIQRAGAAPAYPPAPGVRR